ncbi:hypothetical protein [Catellatospora bangladeshensis]|uniref:Uncharacterized protein n=1 Tax=Catellatospora bangladeshensis TaxID=310355 RepID=A0A8J3NK50_9ACTN|nr:hypothetical protein [Catellatospora bangladeshensis]GIF82678.1 hypothetical protein Cba03nite_40270 [Catellatospora bangladeshensis]
MKAYPPHDRPTAADLADLAELLPDPGHRDLPPGRHEWHRTRLLHAIRDPRPVAAPRRTLLRPVLALAAAAALAGTAAVMINAGDRGSVVTLPTPGATTPAAEPTGGGPVAKIRAYGTVSQLTETADLVVRGEVVRAEGSGGDVVVRVAEVLYRAPGLPGTAEITVRATPIAGMSALAPGQHTVLYLAAADPAAGAYTTLSGDFGIFDVSGETATARSETMTVTGLRAEDATVRGRFAAPLAELRALARARG